MKKQKVDKLFELARTEAAPMPMPEFAADVLRAVRREPAAKPAPTATVFDQLNQWFPRVALAAVTLMILCVAADFALTSAGVPELGEGVAQVSSQFIFDVEDI